MKEQRTGHLREAWVLCFILGLVMINYPFLHIFDKQAMPFGIPLLVLYFQVGWPASIFVIWLFSRSLKKNGDRAETGDDEEKKER